MPFLRALPNCLVAAFAFLLLGSAAHSQITNVTVDQAPPKPGVGHDYIQFLNETVNPVTGSVSIRIGTPTPPGREVTLPFAFTYDSNSAYHRLTDATFTDNLGYLARGGWTYLIPRLTDQVHTLTWKSPGNNFPYTCSFSNSFVFTDLHGSTHSLYLAAFQANNNANCVWPPPQSPPTEALYGGDDYVQGTATTHTGLPVTVADADGTTYYFSGAFSCYVTGSSVFEYLPDWIETRNGNKIVLSGTCGNWTFKDTLGRQIVSINGFGASGNTVSISGLSNYSVSWGTAHFKTKYAVSPTEAQGLGYSCGGGTATYSQPEISAITLPNGKSYQFLYDSSTGLIQEIVYPTGGHIRYVWGVNHFSDIMEFYQDSGGNFSCAMLYDTPALLQRFVSLDGTTEVQEQDFANYSTNWVPDILCSNCQKWTTKSVTVTTHDQVRGTSFETDYSYSPVFVPNSPYDAQYAVTNNELQWGTVQPHQFPLEQTVTVKNSSGSALRTSTKGWYDQYLINCSLETLDNGAISGTFYAYASGAQQSDKSEFDYGLISSTSACPPLGPTAPPTTPTRETEIAYQSFSSTPIFPANPSIFDRPSSVKIYENGTLFAETDYSYDQAAVSPVSNLVSGSHDETNYAASSGAPRGNATTTTKKCFYGSQTCTNAVATYIFDETGQALSKIDPCGNATCSDITGSNHTTSYSYTDNFDSNPSQSTNAYVKQITDPTGRITTFKYAYSDGQLISSTDSNGLLTSYAYSEPLRRLTQTIRSDSGQTNISYNDSAPSPSTTTSKQINSSQSVTTVSVMNGMGHVTQTQLLDPPPGQGNVYTDTKYDGLGRVYTVSNPYRSGNDPTTSSGITTYVYDALGRKTSETYPDNSVLTTTYCGPNTLVTDPTHRWRRSRSDGLARLVEVDEPNAVGATVNSNGCPGQSDPVWATSYGYVLENPTSVLQYGSHSRSFGYDSLSRLLTSTNPESGTITYTYDANSNVTTKTDARSITTTYGYDVLNREISASYSNGEPTVSTRYDESNCLGLSACQNVGQRTSMTDAQGSESWAYQVDQAHSQSVHVNQRTTNSETRSSTYYADLAGNIKQLVYPSGRVVNYTYDNADRPSTAIDSSNGITYAAGFLTPPTGTSCVATAVCYTPQGTPYALSVGQSSSFTGLNITESFNTRLQPNEIKVSSTGGNAMDISYNYGDPNNNNANAGHVFSIANNLDSTRSQTFTYDQLNRIFTAAASTYATSPSHCWGESYGIDPWGNLQSISPISGSAYTGCTQESGFSCAADGNNRMGTCFGDTYDASGNMDYSYNAESQIVWTGTTHYNYDGAGRRVAKPDGNEPKLYWYGSGGEILTETNPSGYEITDYVYFGGKRVAQVPNDVGLNGGFEQGGLSGWTLSGPGTATAINNPANAHSGNYYAEVTTPPNTTTTLTISMPISAQIGETITSSGWVYNDGTLSSYTRWWIFLVGDGGQCRLDSSDSGSASPLNTWTQQNNSVTVPSWCVGPYTVTIYAEVTSASSTQSASARFDDVTLNGNTLFFAEDSLGTSRILTGVNGVVCYDADFYPYGGERAYTNNCTSHYKFEGKERDQETGNDYFGARYYSNRYGRWFSADWSAVPVAVPYANLTNPQTLNLYSMASDDPESFADLDGHDAQCVSNVAQCKEDLNRLAPGTKVDADGNVHKASVLRRILNHVTGHGSGTALVTRIVNNSAMTKIDPVAAGELGGQSAGAVTYLVNGVQNSNAFATYDENGGLAPGSATGAVILGHELIHQDHLERGGQDNSIGTHTIGVGSDNIFREHYRVEEFRTVGFSPFVKRGDITENMLRGELGEAPRATYNPPDSLEPVPPQ